MSETLVIGGVTYNNVAGFKATDDQSATQTYIKPSGSLSISTNDTYDVTQYASAVVNVSGGNAEAAPNDVNFIDYDGTVLYSYSASEFANLSALPENPSHSGLTSQGWNWTLADAKAQVAAIGFLDIGQMYVTDDGKTRIYVEIQEERKSISIGLAVNGTVTVDWGDGSSVDTITGTSETAIKYSPDHTYASGGYYVIKLSSSGSYTIEGNSGQTSYLIVEATTHKHFIGLTSTVKKIELGYPVRLYTAAFYRMLSLSSITIPKDTTMDGQWIFVGCSSLKAAVIPSRSDSAGITIKASLCSGANGVKYISLPKAVTQLENEICKECYALQRVSLPYSITSIGTGEFKSCPSLNRVNIPSGLTSLPNEYCNGGYSLIKIVIPSGITSIGSASFYNNYTLKEIHFLPATPPTVSASNTFTSLPTDCIIYVPTGKLSAYTSASNYPSSATYTYVEE